MQENETSQQEEMLIKQEFEALLDDYRHSVHRQKVEIITKAFHFAKQAHRGVRRRSGEPYIMHPLAVARIVVSEIGLGSTSICAALLHDVVEDTEYTTEDIENLFGPKIASIVDGLTKISGGVFGKQASEQAENFRKLLLTMSEDIRVILIKIADRLHNMRTLQFQPVEKQYKIAGETQYIYAPLAHRLGLFNIKTELENLSFKYENPETYAEIEQKLAEKTPDQLAFFEEFAQPIREKLEDMGYEFDLNARIKSVYSIWRKMQAKNIPFEDVYDLLAVRIIFDPKPDMSEKDQCWMVYSALTNIYTPHPQRIRDWISTPKANGYEALHVTLMSKNGQWVEVQIRTRRMHEIAEKGLAAHWKYKTGVADETELDKWLRTIKEMLEHPEPSAIDFLDTFKLNLFASEIFVFTPTGEIKTMPQGSTTLDFAFMLHTELGLHCIGAKVNRKLEPLDYVLKGGDQVEILTSHNQEPQPEWLDIATTAKARSTLKAWFRRQERQLVRHGEELYQAELQRLHLENQQDAALYKMLRMHGIKQPSQLMLLIGKGAIDPASLQKAMEPKRTWRRFIPFMSDGQQKTDPTKEPATDTAGQTEDKPEKAKKQTLILTEENIGKEYHIAPCCHPIPGDEVLGYLDESGQMVIHKRSCPVAMKLRSSYGKNLYSAVWSMHRQNTYIETIEFEGIDRVGVIIKMLKVISDDFKINIHDMRITASTGIFSGRVQLYVYDTHEIRELCEALSKIKDVQTVRRIVNMPGLDDVEDID
ncbi:MAG: bifunctional (p)ppGpp synthetase/guanosine-3',5'-bis(diphosphate) 3'-pyrophosphohydrolase [Paludibacteraceae bacterium]|nr:bifunctional (p)ppGpp synthetase/guanosine-3',5'-bis(diphosphate) 3'-pyrophosphohydrolase [Paludibacteraceae bacterium]